MILSGKEKVLVLLKFLGPYSQEFLKYLKPEKAEKLMVNIENAPVIENDMANSVFTEVISKAENLLQSNESEVAEKSEETMKSTRSDALEEGASVDTPERDLSGVVDLLINEKPQIIAFFLSRLNENERINVLNFIPDNINEKIKGLEVENVPLADKIFNSLYQKIFQNLN